MATVAEKMTAIAGPMRTLSGRTDKLNLDEMAAIVTDANAKVSSQADLIAQISEALESKGGSSATMGAETLKGNTDSLNAVLEQVNSLSASGPVLQEKTVSPTTSKQTVTPDNNYDGLSKVTVNAMPTATQATPSIEISSAGLITAKATQSAGYVAAGTKQATKQLTTQAAKTVTPGKSDQTAVASGRYTTGAIIVKGDSALEPGNIKSGVSIFGVPGSYTGSGGGGGSGGSVETCQVTFDPMSYIPENFVAGGWSSYHLVKALSVNDGNIEIFNEIVDWEGLTISCVKNSFLIVEPGVTHPDYSDEEIYIECDGDYEIIDGYYTRYSSSAMYIIAVNGDTTIYSFYE